jgi:tRNA pseudouridine55 synthase
LKIINIDKPKGWTSYDVVHFIKRQFNEKKVGHLGTLDPLATGVLPVFLGKATRLIPLFNESDKTYRAVCKLGESTDTYDAEGTVTNCGDISSLNPLDIIKTVNSFHGNQIQKTPAFSAAKVKGVPAYKLARQGLNVPDKTRSVIFHELVVESIELPYVQIWIHCSKGTYIRSLANDLGQVLNVGAYLTSLERLACGKWFNSENSVTVEKLKMFDNENEVPWISPLEVLDHLYTVVSNNRMVSLIKHGRTVELTNVPYGNDNGVKAEKTDFVEGKSDKQAKVIDTCQNLVAIGRIIWENGGSYFKPTKVFV